MKLKNIKFIFITFIILISTSQIALADIYSSNKFYFGTGISSSSLIINDANTMARFSGNDDVTTDGNHISLELLFGYKLDEYLTLELGLVDIGTVTAINNSQSTQLLSVSSLYIDTSLEKKLSAKITVFTKIGISMWSTTLGNSTNSFEEGTGFIYGAGFDLNLYGNDDRKLRLEYKRHNFESLYLKQADSLSMTLMLYF